MADAEWTRVCEGVRRFAPAIGAVGEWRAFCEGEWTNLIPAQLPDPDKEQKDSLGQQKPRQPKESVDNTVDNGSHLGNGLAQVTEALNLSIAQMENQPESPVNTPLRDQPSLADARTLSQASLQNAQLLLPVQPTFPSSSSPEPAMSVEDDLPSPKPNIAGGLSAPSPPTPSTKPAPAPASAKTFADLSPAAHRNESKPVVSAGISLPTPSPADDRTPNLSATPALSEASKSPPTPSDGSQLSIYASPDEVKPSHGLGLDLPASRPPILQTPPPTAFDEHATYPGEKTLLEGPMPVSPTPRRGDNLHSKPITLSGSMTMPFTTAVPRNVLPTKSSTMLVERKTSIDSTVSGGNVVASMRERYADRLVSWCSVAPTSFIIYA